MSERGDVHDDYSKLEDANRLLKRRLKRALSRLRAVKQYHQITDSHIDAIIRRGYGS